MKKLIGLGVLACGVASLGFGSTIVDSGISFTDGNLRTVTLSSFDAFGNTMDGMVVTVNFGSGSESCTWGSGGSPAPAGCSVANQFAIGFAPAAGQTHPDETPIGFWYIDDLRGINRQNPSANNIVSVTIDTFPGNVALDRCMSNNSTFNDSNNTLLSDCSGVGTTGSNIGWTANDGPLGNNIDADAAYTNRLQTSTQNVGDLYSFLTLTFDQGGTHFNPGERFTWRMDTDLLTTAPEPATLVLVGGALLGIGIWRRRSSGRR